MSSRRQRAVPRNATQVTQQDFQTTQLWFSNELSRLDRKVEALAKACGVSFSGRELAETYRFEDRKP